MNDTSTEQAYRKASLCSASPAGLLVLLCDRLASDLQRAIAAIHFQDVEARVAEIQHALLVIQQLEATVDPGLGTLARKLSLFYAQTRKAIFEAHMQVSVPRLQKQIESVLELRRIWQQLDEPMEPSQQASPAAPAPSTDDSCVAPVRSLNLRA